MIRVFTFFIVFLFSFFLSAQKIKGNSEVFSKSKAEKLISSPQKLKVYLDKFSQENSAFYYEYYKRTSHNFFALLYFIDSILQSKDKVDSKKAYKTFLFLFQRGFDNALKHKRISNLKGLQGDEVDCFLIEDKYFAFFREVYAVYGKSGGIQSSDSWLMWKTLVLMFAYVGSSGKINWHKDEAARRVWEKYYKLWNETALKGYLGFFSFFVNNDKSLLPSFKIYENYLSQQIVLSKGLSIKNSKMFRKLVYVVGQMSIENISIMPRVVYLGNDDFLKKYSTFKNSNLKHKKLCSYFKTREKFLTKIKDDQLNSVINYNKILSRMNDCLKKPLNPFFIERNVIYIQESESQTVDIPLMLYFVKKNHYKLDVAKKIITAALYSTMWKNEQSKEKSKYSEMLKYVFFTGRISLFVDSVLLYPYYRNQKFSQKQLDKLTYFISELFAK